MAHIYRSLWITAVIILFLLALLLTAARLATPLLVKKRAEVEHLASSLLHQPVQIGNLEIHWEKFEPLLHTTQVVIYDDGKTHPLLKMDELDLKINILDSILNGRLALGELIISGAKLTVRQTPQGGFLVQGVGSFNPNTPGDDAVVFLDWLLTAPRLALQNITLDWYNKNGILLPLQNVNIHFHNTDFNQHYISGQASLAQTIPTQLQFIVSFSDNWQEKQKINARFYLSAQNFLLHQFLQNYSLHNFTVDKGLANFQIWGRWQNQQLQYLQSLFALDDTHVTAVNHKNSLVIHSVNGNLLWQKNKDSWNLAAQLNDLNFNRWEKIPGIKNLNAYIHLTPTGGNALLQGKATQLDFGSLFRKPLVLQQLDSQVQWQAQKEGWIIQSNNTHVHTSDADAQGKMNLLIPADGSSPIINLTASLQMFGRKNLDNYLPIGILSAGLVNWLKHSILSVDKSDSTLILRGPIHSFPFDQNDGIFIVDSAIENLDLNYWPGWPQLTHIQGNLSFNNRSMAMQIDSAQIYSTFIKNIQTSIPIIKKNILALLQVDANIPTDLADVMKFLQNSPLHKDVLNNIKNVEGTGPTQLNLHLAIPLEHTTVKTAVQGQMQFQNNELKTPYLALQNLQGPLNFTRNDFKATALNAILWKKPITLSVTNENSKPQLHFHYDDLIGDLISEDNRMLLILEGANLKGQIVIPHDADTALEANFQRLYIKPGMTDNLQSIDPKDIPKLNLTAADVQYGSKHFGQIQLQLAPTDNTLQINKLQVTATAFNLSATGSWKLQDHNDITQLNGTMTSNNLGATLASWDLPSSITAKQTRLQFNLSWPDAAYNPSLKTMSGKLSLKMQNGEITNIGPAAAVKMDIGRLLSILSLESLTRRLRLDFSDLTDRGFPFDNLQGDFQMVSGNAYTRNITITGPIANVGIAGRIGLGAEDYDLMLNVTPKITASLPALVGIATSPLAPVAGLALGPVGPAVGAAAWVATKLVGGAVNKLATDTYHMTGAWANPRIQQVGNYWTPQQNKK